MVSEKSKWGKLRKKVGGREKGTHFNSTFSEKEVEVWDVLTRATKKVIEVPA